MRSSWMPRGYRLPCLLSLACYDIETLNFLDALYSCCSRLISQSSFSSVVLAWLSKIASVLSASSGGAVKFEGVAGLLAVAELLSLSWRSAPSSVLEQTRLISPA